MKIKLIALAISGVALPLVSMAGPAVYGTADISLNFNDLTDLGGADNIELNSNWAQVGVRGSEALTDDLSAVYNANFDVNFDEGATITEETMYAGLRGTWGELIVGRMYSPLSNIQGSIDKFDWHYADMAQTFGATENVINNLINYTSPKMNGLHFVVALQPGEESGDDSRDGIDGLSASVAYDHDSGLGLALGVDSELSDGAAVWDAVRFAASYSLEGIDLGLMYQTAEDATVDNADELQSLLVSAAAAVSDEVTARVQYQQSEVDVDGADTYSVISLGGDYALGQATNLYAEYSLADDSDNDGSVIALGMRHQF